MKTYAAYYDNIIREKSSSGGLFSLIASKYEIIYGVAMTDDCHSAEFRRVIGDISLLRGSKYFQARVGNAFQQAKMDLDSGRSVLFTGTGCQINGLKMFLQKEYENLFTMDVICHGVPSPKLWDTYASYREKEYGEKLKSVHFRSKKMVCSDFGIKENEIYISKDEDSFMQMFLKDYCLRPACYQCHARNLKMSDLTVGDFWGIENVAPEMNDGRGTSIVITRTSKGQEVFDAIKPNLQWKEVSYEDGVRSNPSEHLPPERPVQRDSFFHDLLLLPFPDMERKYLCPSFGNVLLCIWQKTKNTIRRIVLSRKDNRATFNSDYGLLFTFER